MYTQALSGPGHFVRTFEIARALAGGHDVYLVDGGRAIPRSMPDTAFKLLHLPQIYRDQADIVPVDSARIIDDVMSEKKQLLIGAVGGFQPRILVIEYFPFSKCKLYSEIITTIERVRAIDHQVTVICSLRDISPQPYDIVSNR